jgi:hypothetical protein
MAGGVASVRQDAQFSGRWPKRLVHELKAGRAPKSPV